ncbi:MspA family porin [Nocardia sp. NPDC046473]|uniref:MspA family porin n=1 Tax=Nocardia sp. NPDC046473 TaxID=3155733 RepID=UPI0034052121
MRGSLCAAVACAFLLVPAGMAHADTSVTLPDGHDQFTVRDGVVAAVDRTGEQATISSSMAASPLSRNAWVSGVTSIHLTVPAEVRVSGGRIETGYLVGCQVDLGSATHADGSGDTPSDPKPDTPDKPGKDGGGGNDGLSAGGNAGGTVNKSGVSPYADPSMSIQLKPGKIATKKIEDYSFTGTSGITQYVNHTLSVEGCAGAAEARAYTTVTVHDNVMDDSETLWGHPFSLG